MEKTRKSFPYHGKIPAVLVLYALVLVTAGCSKPEPQLPELGAGETLALSGEISTNRIRIGDPVQLTLTALHPTNTTVVFPDISSGKDVLIRKSDVESQVLPNGIRQTVNHLTLTSMTVTNHILGENQPVLLSTPDGIETNRYPFFSLEVASSLQPGETDPRPAKTGLADWPAPPSRLLWILAGVLALLIAGGLALRRFLNTPRTILHKAPSIPPYRIALDAIEALRGKGWIEDGLVEPFYVELSGIVRQYLESRFGLRAPERTTEEFIHDMLTAKCLNSAQRDVLAQFLEQSDLVKFARHRPGITDMHNALDSGVNLIRETMPAAARATEAAETGSEPAVSAGGEA